MNPTIAKIIREVDEAYKIWIEAIEKFAKRPTLSGQKKIRYYSLDLNLKKRRLTQKVNDYRFWGENTNGED